MKIYLEKARSYDAVIVFCGNNDLTDHPRKSWLTAARPEVVAASLMEFKNALLKENHNVNVKIIGLIPRPDTPRELVQKTNDILYLRMRCSYCSPKYIEPYDFSDDNVHLNLTGISPAGRLLKRLIEFVL